MSSHCGDAEARSGTLQYSFSKAKLPKGTSYPLKRSALDSALARADVRSLASVDYLKMQRADEVMRADYHGEHRKDYFASGKIFLRVYSVPSKQRAAIEAALLDDGIKAIIAWAKKAETAGNTWRAVDHQLVLIFSWPSLRFSDS